MSTVHLSLATGSDVPYSVVSKALGIRKSHVPDGPTVFLDGCETKREEYLRGIGAIVKEAKRRADLVRETMGADVGVGIARGPAEIRYNHGARLCKFELVVIVATEEGGVVAYDVPTLYPDEAYGSIIREAFTECERMSSPSPRYQEAAAIATIAWSRLDFPDVKSSVEFIS